MPYPYEQASSDQVSKLVLLRMFTAETRTRSR